MGHSCVGDSGGKNAQLQWQAGDRVIIFYRSAKNGGPEFCAGEVLLVNDDCAAVQFSEESGISDSAVAACSGIVMQRSTAVW